MKMKKGSYYISCRKNENEVCLHKVSGWIIHDDESKLDFGAKSVGHKKWEVTELSTGNLVTAFSTKLEHKSDVIPFIDRTRDIIVRAMESRQDRWFEMCKNAIKKAYEEDLSKCCSLPD